MSKWKVTAHNGDRVGRVINGDCVDVLKSMDSDSVDSIITDPPYEIGFMGKGHDKTGIAYDTNMWAECLRVLKPGGHLLSFGAPKTYHRMAVAVEDAGFEIRDSIFWCYGSGFPKSLSISKAVESTLLNGSSHTRALRKTEQEGGGDPYTLTGKNNGILGKTRVYDRKTFSASTDKAQQWEGWGTALKPAVEPIVVARKPLEEKTVAKNILKHGTGGLNIDGTRVGHNEPIKKMKAQPGGNKVYGQSGRYEEPTELKALGRWPANLILGHSEDCKGDCADDCPIADLDRQSGTSTSRVGKPRGTKKKAMFANSKENKVGTEHNDSGGASRFFHTFQMESPLIYQSKANKKERPTVDGTGHSTVKPLDLMRNLVRLVTPPDGIVLDPFGGSGTTGEAALLEDVVFILIEKEQTYIPLIKQRMERNGYCVKQVNARKIIRRRK